MTSWTIVYFSAFTVRVFLYIKSYYLKIINILFCTFGAFIVKSLIWNWCICVSWDNDLILAFVIRFYFSSIKVNNLPWCNLRRSPVFLPSMYRHVFHIPCFMYDCCWVLGVGSVLCHLATTPSSERPPGQVPASWSSSVLLLQYFGIFFAI